MDYGKANEDKHKHLKTLPNTITIMKLRLETRYQKLNAEKLKEGFKKSGKEFKEYLEKLGRERELREKAAMLEDKLPKNIKGIVKPIQNIISKISTLYPNGGLSDRAYNLLRYKAYKVLRYSIIEYALDNGCDPTGCTEEGAMNSVDVMGINEERFRNHLYEIMEIIKESPIYKNAKTSSEKVHVFTDMFDLALTKVIEQYEAHGMKIDEILLAIKKAYQSKDVRCVEQTERRLDLIFQIIKDL